MRKSSNDLTKYSRNYVVTENPIWEERFWEVLDKRSGDAFRKALLDSLSSTGYVQEEFDMFGKAIENSDALARIEEEAMNMVKGRYPDEHGEFTIEATPNKEKAIDLLHNEAYLTAKSGILDPIAKFEEMVNIRTTKEAEALTRTGERLLTSIFLLIAFVVVFSGLAFFLIRRRIKKEEEISEELIRSQQQFESLVNSIPGIIYNCDLDDPWDMHYITDEIEEITGYPKEDFLGKNPKRKFGDIMHPDDRTQASEQVQKAIAANESYVLDYRIFHKDGRLLYVNGYGKAMRGSDKNPDYLVGGIFDNTEKKQAEEQLSRNQQQFNAFVDSMPGVIYICALEHPYEVFYVSDEIDNLSGYPKEDYLGLNPSRFLGDLIHPDDVKRTSDAVELAIENGQSFKMDYRITRKDGRIRYINDYGQVMYKNDGTPELLIGGFFDDSERYSANEKVKESEQRFQLAAKGSNAGIWDLDVASGLAYWSDIHYELLGYKVGEITPSLGFIQDSVFSEDLDHFLSSVQTHIEKGTLLDFEARFHIKNGDLRWFRSRGAAARDEGGKAVRIVGTFTDITEKKESETALAAKEQQLQYALDVSNEGIWEWNDETDSISYSLRCFSMIGYLPVEGEQALEEFWLKVIHKDDAQKALVNVVDKVKKTGLYDHIYRAISNTKEIKWIHVKGKAVEFSDNGNPSRIIGTMSDITDRMRQEEKIVNAILETEDNERSRIARDIHDGLQQTMSTSLMNFEKVRSSIDFEDPKIYDKFHTGYQFLKKSIAESRTLAHNLMPKVVDQDGIVAAIESLISAMETSTETQFVFEQNINDQRLKLSEEMTFYRIVQEAINNVIKYSRAKKCTIQLLKYSDMVNLTIDDDGVGFDLSKTGNTFGLNSMKTRADSIGAYFEINSRVGKGTNILLELNLS